VTRIAIFASQKKEPPFLGRRPFGVAATSNSRPSGAQGRKTVKISIDVCRLPLHRKAAHGHQRRLAFEFFARLGFLALLHWFRGWVHCHPSSAELRPSKLGFGCCNSPSKIFRCLSIQTKPLIKGYVSGDSALPLSSVEFCSAALTYSTITSPLKFHAQSALDTVVPGEAKGTLMGAAIGGGAESLVVGYFAQGERMRGLVGSILVAFFSCLDVFFCFMALSYRVLCVDCLLVTGEES
jgi:hypothetical protein